MAFKIEKVKTKHKNSALCQSEKLASFYTLRFIHKTVGNKLKMKHALNILLLILTLISCKNKSELKTEIAQIEKTELIKITQTDSLSELWNVLVFEKGGCLGGEQYVSETEFKREEKPLVFSEMDWKKFSDNDKGKLTEFLITKLSDTTKTKVHTCPFFGATNGEMAVYSLQHIYKKNWYDFSEFKEYKDKEYKSATEQPQMWLQNILKSETDRKKLAELYKNELKK